MSIAEVETFVEAALQGSMAAASRALGVPTSTVSRRIRRLEEELGVQLVESHARLFRLTEAGDTLFKRSVAAVRDLREAAHAIRDGSDAVKGQLRISAAQDIGSSEPMVQLISDFRAAHPGIDIVIDITDRHVDLVADGVDFAFRVQVNQLKAQSSLMARRLTTLSGGLFASPTYLERHGTPKDLADLASHALISPTFGLPWKLRHEPTGRIDVLDMPVAVQATSLSFMVPAARLHMGIAPSPDLVAGAWVKRNHLVRVLPEWGFNATTLSLLWPASRLPAPRRRRFLDFVVEQTRSWPSVEAAE